MTGTVAGDEEPARWGDMAEIARVVATSGVAARTLVATTRFLRKVCRKIARATGGRPMISLGAAEYLAMADLTDRTGATPRLLGSGDMCSQSSDRGFTGGDAFFVVLATESELHHYHVSAYGEVHYIGTSPPIRHQWDDPPPYWAGGGDEPA